MANQNTSMLAIVLWIVQGVLAAIFLMAGSIKATQPLDQLVISLPWAAHTHIVLVRFIGISEVLGSLGLVLPTLLRIRPMLTPLAAVGLVLIMLLAAGLHLTRGETATIGINLMIASLAAFVAWGRTSGVIVQPKNSI